MPCGGIPRNWISGGGSCRASEGKPDRRAQRPGQGIREIRIREKGSAFRIIYVVKFEAAVYVLHCFQKKTQATPEADLALAGRRYRELTRELSA
jgi:phage-related protein